MAIFVMSMDGKEARDLILQRLKENDKKPEKDQDIKTWKVEQRNGKDCLVYKPANWGECGHFELSLDGEVLKLGLRVAPEHYKKGAKWPDLVGALHSELIQLLLNHFSRLAKMDGNGLKVVYSCYPNKQ